MNKPNAKPERCDRGRLEALLDDRLGHEESSDLEQHLNQCQACRTELDALCETRAELNEVGQFLSSSDWTKPSLANDGARSERPAFDKAGTDHTALKTGDSVLSPSDAEWTDFTVNYLEACEKPGTVGSLAGYEIISLIGRGGMGMVLRANDRTLNRPVAVKVMSPVLAMNAAARRRFEREARAIAAVVHPNVVSIHQVDAHARVPYLVMPFVSGESLQQRLDRVGYLDTVDILRIALQAARGLSAAHRQGIIHRDVKPANILLEPIVGRVLLTDFGLARAMDEASFTCSGVLAGTPPFMSPEQAEGRGIDHRSDLFSLGSVMYAMATGRPPFRSETIVGVLRQICERQPEPVRGINPDIPAWLAGVIDKLMSKRADDRYASADELADTLEACLAHVQQPTAIPLPAGLPVIAEPANVAATMPNRPIDLRQLLIAISVTGCVMLAVGLALPKFWPGFEPAKVPNQLTHTSVNNQQQTNDQSEKLANTGQSADSQSIAALPPGMMLELKTRWHDDMDSDLYVIDQRIKILEERSELRRNKEERKGNQ